MIIVGFYDYWKNFCRSIKREFENNSRFISKDQYKKINIMPKKAIVMTEEIIENIAKNFADTFINKKETEPQFAFIVNSCEFTDIELIKIRKASKKEGRDKHMILIKYAIQTMISIILKSIFMPKTKEI